MSIVEQRPSNDKPNQLLIIRLLHFWTHTNSDSSQFFSVYARAKETDSEGVQFARRATDCCCRQQLQLSELLEKYLAGA